MIFKTIVSAVLYLVLAPFVGCILVGWQQRLSAKMQGRKGASILQPFYDVKKLMTKQKADEKNIYDYYVKIFLLFMMISGVVFFAGGDMLFVVLAFLVAEVFLITAAYASNSVSAHTGAEYELLGIISCGPMLMFTVIGFYMYCGSLGVRDILMGAFMPVFPLIGVFAGFMVILMIRFKNSPLDIKASGDIVGNKISGLTSEFSGKTLAIVEVARWYESVLMFAFVFLFFGSGTLWGIIVGVLITLIVFAAAILISNSTASMRWKTVIKAAWTTALVLGTVNIFMLYVIM